METHIYKDNPNQKITVVSLGKSIEQDIRIIDDYRNQIRLWREGKQMRIHNIQNKNRYKIFIRN